LEGVSEPDSASGETHPNKKADNSNAVTILAESVLWAIFLTSFLLWLLEHITIYYQADLP